MMFLPLLLNPYVILAALLSLAGSYFYGHHKGYVERDLEAQAQVVKLNEEARVKEQELNTQINNQAYKLKEANDVVSQKQVDLDRAIRAGRLRLPTASCVQAPASAAPSAGDRSQARGQSDRPADAAAGADDADRATLAAIAEIVAQGDRNTAQLNACIDAYNEVRKQLNGDK